MTVLLPVPGLNTSTPVEADQQIVTGPGQIVSKSPSGSV